MSTNSTLEKIRCNIESDLSKGFYDDAIFRLYELLEQNLDDDIFNDILFLLAKTSLLIKQLDSAKTLISELLTEEPLNEKYLSLQSDIQNALTKQILSDKFEEAQSKDEIFNILKYGYQLLKYEKFPLEIHRILSERLFSIGKAWLGHQHLLKALEYDPHNKNLLDNMVSYLQYAPNTSPDVLLPFAQKYEKAAFPDYEDRRNKSFSDIEIKAHKKTLRLGFVSGDFKKHAIFLWIGNLFPELKNYDIEIFCYCNNHHDEATELFIQQSDKWNDIYKLSDFEAVKLIRQDKIDILIDLSGHTVLNRLGIFSLRAAPIQISWLGQAGPLGIKNIDYVLSDKTLFNTEEEYCYSEKIYTLPNIYASCNKDQAFATERKLSESPYKKNGFITFGSFTNMIKMNRECFDLWIQILRSVPKSKLYLKNHALANADIKQYINSYFLNNGIASERLILEEASKTRGEYIECYRRVDICLDSIPVGGYTTSLDVLYMGIPLVTLYGNKIHHRASSSLLRTLNFEELITFNKEEYIEKATELAFEPEKLDYYKKSMREKLFQSDLFNVSKFAKDFSDAMRDIWRRFIDEQPQ